MYRSPPSVEMIKAFVRYLSLQTAMKHKEDGRESSFFFFKYTAVYGSFQSAASPLQLGL